MARAYTIATAALALGVSDKWLDNTLSHFKVEGVRQKRQGVARQLTVDSLLVLSVATILGAQLHVPLGTSIDIAQRLIAAGGHHQTEGILELHLDLQIVRARLFERLEHAVETAPTPRRGRPPKNTTGRLD
jgi:hypothetical protein